MVVLIDVRWFISNYIKVVLESSIINFIKDKNF